MKHEMKEFLLSANLHIFSSQHTVVYVCYVVMIFCLINKIKCVSLTHLDKNSYFGDSYGSSDQ